MYLSYFIRSKNMLCFWNDAICNFSQHYPAFDDTPNVRNFQRPDNWSSGNYSPTCLEAKKLEKSILVRKSTGQCFRPGVPNPRVVAHYWVIAYLEPGRTRGTLVRIHARVHVQLHSCERRPKDFSSLLRECAVRFPSPPPSRATKVGTSILDNLSLSFF